jgi:hypothetical protein
MQAMKVKARDVHIRRLRGYFQHLQDTHALFNVIRTDPARLAGQIYFFKPFMPETADHSSSVNYLVYSVNSKN